MSSAARRGGGYSAYAKRDVAGSLRNRKLLSAGKRPTAAGEQAWVQLDTWLDVGRGPLKTWVHDRTWLRAYLAGAGAAVLLAELANPGQKALHEIGRTLTLGPPDDLAFAVAIDDRDPGLDFAAIPDSLRGAFDSAFAVLNAAFAGGGGDGGGGDGGGG